MGPWLGSEEGRERTTQRLGEGGGHCPALPAVTEESGRRSDGGVMNKVREKMTSA